MYSCLTLTTTSYLPIPWPHLWHQSLQFPSRWFPVASLSSLKLIQESRLLLQSHPSFPATPEYPRQPPRKYQLDQYRPVSSLLNFWTFLEEKHKSPQICITKEPISIKQLESSFQSCFYWNKTLTSTFSITPWASTLPQTQPLLAWHSYSIYDYTLTHRTFRRWSTLILHLFPLHCVCRWLIFTSFPWMCPYFLPSFQLQWISPNLFPTVCGTTASYHLIP